MAKANKCACTWRETRQAGVKDGLCQKCGGQTEMPDRPSDDDMEAAYKRVGARAAAEVASWPEWRKHPTLVPRDQRRPPSKG